MLINILHILEKALILYFDPNLNMNTKNYRYNHKYRDAIEKHFISLIEKY